MSRKAAREYAYKLVFEYIFNRDIVDSETKNLIFQDPELTAVDADYINTVYDGVRNKYDELVECIARNAKNFRLDRIFKPDLAALLLAIYEMKYMDDIPLNVSISEAVDLAKEYATDKSYIFVNGVLAGVYKEIQK